jgi:hypothetical protein
LAWERVLLVNFAPAHVTAIERGKFAGEVFAFERSFVDKIEQRIGEAMKVFEGFG